MLTLHNLQSQFRDTLLTVPNNDLLATQIRANGLQKQRRLQIYRNNVQTGLTDALRAVYPMTQRLIGEACFCFTAQHYLEMYPSTSSSLLDFGNHFPEFVAVFPALQSLPYLTDVARLEGNYHEVFHAADAPNLNLMLLGTISEQDYDTIQFQLHPSSKLFSSSFPILKIWQFCLNNLAEETLELSSEGINLLVIRRNLEIIFEELTTGEFWFLTALSQGKVLKDACEQVLQKVPDFDISTCLQQQILRSNVVSFSR